MSKQIEALKMAIEALKDSLTRQDVAINTCEEALADAEKQEWQSLIDDEIKNVWFKVYPLNENNLWADMLDGKHLLKFARAIEQALKEKNHDIVDLLQATAK